MMGSAIGGGAATNLPAAYLGQVATRCFVPWDKYPAAAGRWEMTRSMHIARDDIANPTVLFANFYVTTSQVETTTGPGTIKAAIEYPAGTFTLANECVAAGNAAVPFPVGITALTFNVQVPRGKQFWVRALQVNANGTIYRGGGGDGSIHSSDGWEDGTGTPSDKVTGGTVAYPTGWHASYAPIAILSMTRRPSFLIIGDSVSVGAGIDVVSDAGADLGVAARLIGSRFGYTNLSVSSSQLQTFIAASRTYRDQLKPYFSHVLLNHAYNDLVGGGQTAAQFAARVTQAAAFYPGKIVVRGTSVPTTSTTDGYATLANQTIPANGTKIMDFNNMVRAGIAGIDEVIDFADLLDPARTGKWPVARDTNAAVGTAGFATTDGIHPKVGAAELVRDRGVGRVALFER